MRLKHIEVFNALMLTGTVSGAAKLLHVTQPAATQSLQLAELQLGYQLFTRQRRRLVPTREAHALYVEVQKLMTQLESVKRLAQALGEGDSSRGLRILIVPSLAIRALPDALGLFRQRHPKIAISVRTLHSNEIARAIALQEGDVGIVYGSVMHAGLNEAHIATGRLVCVSRVGKKGDDRRSTVALEDLMREPFIRIDERDPLGAMLADQFSRMGGPPVGGMSVQTHHIAMVLAEQGFGPAIIDSFTAQASQVAELHMRTVTPEIPIEVRALMPRGDISQRPVDDFIAALRAAIASA